MKKLTSLLTAATIILSSAVHLTAVNAAERSFLPWELYKVNYGTNDLNSSENLNAYFKDGIQWFATSDSTAGTLGSMALLGQEFIPQVGNVSETNTGTVAVCFDIPYDSIWNVEGQFSNLTDVNFGMDVNVGIVDVYKLPEGISTITSDYKLEVGDQMLHAVGGTYYADPVDESMVLKKGDTLVFHTRTSDNNAAAIALSIRINKLKITDENNPDVSYDLFNILNVAPTYEFNKNLYRLEDYNNIVSFDDNPWKMYFAKHTAVENINPSNWIYADNDNSKNDEGVNDVFDDTGNDYKIFHTNGGQIHYSSKGTLPIYTRRAVDDGSLANNYTNGVISWTAPHAGNWIVEVGIRNEWPEEAWAVDVGNSQHWLGYITDAKEFKTIQEFNGPSVVTCKTVEPYASGAMQVNTLSIYADKGEEICLFNQNSSFYDYSYIELKFINADDPTEIYSSNNIGKVAMTADNGGDSPFDMFVLNSHETYDKPIDLFMVKTGYSQDDVNIGIVPAYPLSINKEKGTFNVATNTTAERAGLMFKFPEDGKYVMTLSIHNNTDTNDGIIQYWYHDNSEFSGLTQNKVAKYTDGVTISELGKETAITKIYDAGKNDIAYISFGNYNNPVSYAVDVQFEKIDKTSSFNFYADGIKVRSFEDIVPYAGKSLNCSYTFNNQKADTTYTALVAVYDNSGKMLKLDISDEMQAEAGAVATGTLSVDIPEEISGGSVKAFIWRDINDITPLTNSCLIK